MTNGPAYHEHLATTTADTRTVNHFDGFDQELNEISSTASENSRSIGTNDSKVTSSTSKPRDLGKCATPEDPPDINFVSAKDACDKNDNYNHRNLNNFQSGGTPQYITSSSAFEAWNKSASKSNLGSALQSACRIGRETSKKNEKNHQISSDQVFESSAINTDVTNQSRKIHPRLSKQYPTPTKVHVVATTPTIDNSRKLFRQISPPSSSFIQSNSAGAFRAPSQAAGIRGVAKYSESHSQKIMTSSCHNYDSNSGTHANDRQYDHTIYSTSSNFSHCSHTEDGSQFYKTSNNLEGKSSYPSLPTSYKNVGYANTETKPAPGNTSTTSNRFDLSAKTTVLSPQQPASNQSFQFASLSPERAAKWDLAQEIQQQENLRHQMEGKDITYSKVHGIPHVGNANVSGSRGRVVNDRQASVPSSTEMDPGIEGSGRKEREDMSVESENSSEISSLPPEERTEYRYDNIDLLLDDHLAEHEINGFDSTDLIQIPQGQADEKSGGRHENGVMPAMGGTTMQPQHQYPQQQLRANPQFWGDQLVCAPSHATKSAEPVTPAPIIPCVTMSDQSTIESSPAMSSGMLKSPGGKQSKHTVENISHDQHHRNKARNIDGLEPNDLGATLKPKNSNGSQIPKEPTNTKNSNVTIPKSSLFDSETALYATLPTTATYSNREVSELRSKLRNVEMQLQNITTGNNSLQNRLVENDIRIEKLVASEEEARQEAALWEARWRDDFACNVEVSDHKPVLAKLRGALLQKSREESESLRTKIKSLQSQIKEMEESYSVQLTTLVSENKELHKKLEQSEKFIGGSFTKQSTSRSSSITESNPLAQIDRIAKELRESEQRWSSKFATAQKELDQMRREISTLQNKKKELLEKMKSTEKSACDWEKRAIDSKKQLSDCRDELNRATNAKNALLEELNHHRESSELLRKECQSIHEKLEQKLKEETEEQKADSEKTNQILSDDDCARSKTIQELESTVARLSQENDTLVEENASVSKENERLARRFVELERALNTASIEADECRASLQSAENRISSLSEEKEELRETIRRIETEHNATTAELQGISQELANSRSGEERAQEQLIELQQEVEEARREIESLSEQNRMLNSQLSSLNEYHTNAQEELESWQQAKEDLEAEVNTLSAENDRLNIENAAINERLDNSQQLITTLQRSQLEQTSQSGPIVEENRILRSSLAGLEHQIERIESDLSTERQALAATKHARDQAERKIGEMETQIKNLQHDLSSARSAISSKRDENLRLQRDMDEMKKLITSLREENSAAAISRSHLELELKQREDECVSLRRQLDPLQKEKYRLELDNSDLSDQIGKLKMITRDRTDEQEFVPKKNDSSNELVRSLEVKNDELAQYIASLQHDLAKLQNSRLTNDNLQSASPYIPKGSEAPCETQDDKESNETIETKTTTKESNVLHHSCSSHQLVTSKISRSMIEQLSRARAAVKETSLLLKAQRGNIEVGEASVMLSSFNRVQSPPRSNDNKITATPSHEQQTDDRSSGGEYQTPRQSEFASSDFSTASTPIYSIDPSHNESTVQKDRDDDFSYRKRSISPRRESIRLDESSKQVDNAFLRMQMEEKHKAEKDILKTKYRERIRCMRKEWEGERKAILKLISTEPGFEVSNGDRVYQIVKTPVRRLPDKNDNEVADLKTVTLTSQSQTPKVEPTNSSDDSFLETEAFVMSVLNEFEKQSV